MNFVLLLLLLLYCINNQHGDKEWGETQSIMLHDKT